MGQVISEFGNLSFVLARLGAPSEVNNVYPSINISLTEDAPSRSKYVNCTTMPSLPVRDIWSLHQSLIKRGGLTLPKGLRENCIRGLDI